MSRSDCKHEALKTQTGLDAPTNDMFLVYLQNNGATADSIADAQLEFLAAQGQASGAVNDRWFAFLGALGLTGSLADRKQQYWCDLGGALGPTTSIKALTACSCSFVDPTANCTNQCQYQATPINFTEAIASYTWAVTGGTIIAGDGTDTITVETISASNVSVNVQCTIAGTGTETDTRDRNYTQIHTDATVAPVFIGPNINNVSFAEDSAISPFDVSVVFSGDNLAFTTVGTLPAGLTLSSAGVLTGTPTTPSVESLAFRATNSKGSADSNTFTMTITNVQTEVLVVSQVVAGSCTYPFPGDSCTASGQYTATPTGYAPDTWVWSVTTGTASIVSGQGTDTVTVESTASADNIFTLKCIASVGASSAEDLTQFTHTHEESTPAVFHALTYDPTTYEMLGVKTGVGGLTTTHTADLYAPDHEGVYQKFATDAPVWAGGRVTLTGGAGSYVDKVYADDGSGTPLPELPYLQYYPAATNEQYNSNNFSHTDWGVFDGTKVVDQTGIDGTPNTAVTLTDASTSAVSRIEYGTILLGTVGVTVATLVYHVKKDTDQTRFPGIGSFSVGAGTTVNFAYLFNTETGDTLLDFDGNSVSQGIEVIDMGPWWKVCIQVVVTDDTRFKMRVYAARNDSWTTGGNNNATGSVILGQMELHFNKTIAEVRGLGPIFTTTAAASTDRTSYSFDIANHDNDAGAYYCEYKTSTLNSELTANKNNNWPVSVGISGRVLYSNAGPELRSYDGLNIASVPYQTEGNIGAKLGVVYHLSENTQSVNFGGTYGADAPYRGFEVTTALTIIAQATPENSSSAKIRNIQRYDIASFQDGKDKIDELMTNTWETPIMNVGSANASATGASLGVHTTTAWNDQGSVTPTKAPLLGLNVNNVDYTVQLYYIDSAQPHGNELTLSWNNFNSVLLTWNGSRYVSNDVAKGEDWYQYFSDNYNTNIQLYFQETG